MKRSTERIEIPLNWYFGMRIERFIPELHLQEYEKINQKVKNLLFPIFAIIPELDITGSLQERLNDRTQRNEVFYQPMLIWARQYQLPFDDQRTEKLDPILKSCLEELRKIPVMMEALLKAGEVKPQTSLSPQEYRILSMVRTMMDSPELRQFLIDKYRMNTRKTHIPAVNYQLRFQAKVKYKGHESVVVESVTWNKSNPVLVNQHTFEVGFRPTDLLDEEIDYLDRFEPFLRSQQPAHFICSIALKVVHGRLEVKKAFLERLIDD
ncbi:MAG: hypothetical protein ACT4NK_14195 [Limnobacter sp.]|uniref:hypothetical protein n=1 Tax=Limnobacter sp. TaxID=2003368 RepID=UPI00403832E5